MIKIKNYLVKNWKCMWKYKYSYVYLAFSLGLFLLLFVAGFFRHNNTLVDTLNFASTISFLLLILIVLLRLLFIDNMIKRRKTNKEARDKYRKDKLFQKYTNEEKQAYLRLEEKIKIKQAESQKKIELYKTNLMLYLLLIFYAIIFTITIIIIIITSA